MATKSANSLVVMKIAGRYREIPIWATRLSFEVRPSLNFDSRAWRLWKPVLLLLHRVCKAERVKIKWVRIHSHFRLRGEIPHAMGWWDPEEKAMFLCHFDNETMLHEVGHALSSGYHGDPWAIQTARLYRRYMKPREYKRAMDNLGQYLSGRRIYKKVFGARPPKFEHQKSIWRNLEPR